MRLRERAFRCCRGPDNSGEVIEGEYREVDTEAGEIESNPESEPGEGLEDITDELLGEERPENGEDDGYGYEEPEDGSEE